ncbi:protein FAR-RED IMPAIRED RESPONSE 1-like [Castanea sativa]|uniref:protein FAR-RED IMPAIRED RESPONSE 1-like n=1 Tax=Castanea sativa TaxID=21020 RepID=UPI003F6497EB
MMPSQQKVAATHAIEIDLAHESGLRLKQSYELLSKQVGGYDNLDFTKQDHKNYLRTKRQRDMEHRETASLGRYISRQFKKNSSYYFATQLDCEELITNIFWVDARMIIDYSHFGDVIMFDTTYSTNRDARPLEVFLGLNHHRETVVFGACIYEYDCEDEFLTAWNEMLDKYNVRENKWLIDLFILKEKWAQAYVKKTFIARMKTTQLSESFNADLKDCLRTNLNIVEFFTHFERVVNQKRDKEMEAEYNPRHKFPRLKLKSSPMLNQIATMYTPMLFDSFQIEVEEVMALSILERNESQTHSYVVGVFNQYGKYEVMWNPLDGTLSCSCRKFESFGILCRHGLKVLDVLDIKLIPNRYIMKRWRRDVKDGSEKNCTTHNIKPDTRMEYVDRYRDLCPKYIQLVNEACETKEGHDILSLAIAD